MSTIVKEKKRKTLLLIFSLSAAILVIIGVAIGLGVDFSLQKQLEREAKKVYYALDLLCLKHDEKVLIKEDGLYVTDLDFFENSLSYELEYTVDIRVKAPDSIDGEVIYFFNDKENSLDSPYIFTDFTFYSKKYLNKSITYKINPNDFTAFNK